VVLGLAVSCGGKTSSTAVGNDYGAMADSGAVEYDGTPKAPACNPITIDDMEERVGGPAVPTGSGAFFWSMGLGNWFYDWRKDAVAEEIVPPRGDSKRARRLNAYSGNAMECQLNHPSNLPVDLSGFTGITFWARLTGPGGKLVVTIQGKAYSPDEGPFAAEVAVFDAWQTVDVPFADFHDATSAVRPNAKEISDINFTVTGAEAFDLWIDDVALVCSPSL
jgi:hypothetical protein